MKRYIDAYLLQKEIEKREHICDDVFERDSDTYYQGKAVAYQETLFLIDSLQQEYPEVDLEKEIETYFKGWYMDETDQGYILHTPDDHAGLMSVKQIARHFANWGAEHAKKETPVSEGLEEEMDKFFETMPVLEHENIFEDTFKNIARHFYELGKQAKKEE